MPTYEYKCDSCEIEFEIKQGYDDKPIKKCRQCGKQKLRRVFGVPYLAVVGEPKTLGHLAARNRDKFSEDEKYHLCPEAVERTERIERIKDQKPWWGKPPKELSTATDQEKKDYILTGKVPPCRSSEEVQTKITE